MYASYRELKMPQLKLTYFDFKGRGEIIRLICVAGGVTFEDNRIEMKDWPKVKETTPYGSVPMLEVGQVKLAESLALARFVAKEGGLAGSNNLEAAKVDSYVDNVIGLREKIYDNYFSKDSEEKKEAEKMKIFGETVPDKLKAIEKTLGDDAFLVGNQMTWADIALFSVWDGFIKMVDILKDLPTPKLKAIVEKVKNDPKIKDYLSKRKETDL